MKRSASWGLLAGLALLWCSGAAAQQSGGPRVLGKPRFDPPSQSPTRGIVDPLPFSHRAAQQQRFVPRGTNTVSPRHRQSRSGSQPSVHYHYYVNPNYGYYGPDYYGPGYYGPGYYNGRGYYYLPPTFAPAEALYGPQAVQRFMGAGR